MAADQGIDADGRGRLVGPDFGNRLPGSGQWRLTGCREDRPGDNNHGGDNHRPGEIANFC